MSYKTPYIDIPLTKPERVGRATMPKNSTSNEVKQAKRYSKNRTEHYKDIVIAVLITGVIAFVGGMHFSNNQHATTERAVTAATTVKK